MSKLFKVVILLVAVTIGYIVGNYFPTSIFKPDYVDENIHKTEYYRLLISVVSAFITFCAVVVALFKDDIREYWMRPQIEFNLPSQSTFEDLDSPQDSGFGNDTLVSYGYTSRIEVKNVGNLAALNAEIYLDSLHYTPHQSEIVQEIESPSTAMEWNGTDLQSIIIPPGGKKYVNIVEVTPPEKVSTPESEKETKPATLIIGNISNSKDRLKGKWTATFTLYAQNHKPISFCVVVEWNGVWKSRLTEFDKQYKISKKI